MHTVFEVLEHQEGFRHHAYKDHLGFWTIGYGRLIDKRRGGGISRNEGRVLLEHDVERVSHVFDRRIPWWRALSYVRQTVLISMGYQMGPEGALRFRRMLAHLRREDYERAAVELLDSRMAVQTPVRAHELAHMMRHDEVPQW